MTSPPLAAAAPILCPYASAEFNASFWQELNYLSDDVKRVLGDDLIAIVLGGGFGRSEGCVAYVNGAEQPYNDVDLFLVTKTRRPKHQAKLHRLVERYEDRLHIAIDFSQPQTLSMITKWKPLLMWQELANSHFVLSGPADVLKKHVPSSVLERLPAVEASRLLLNRGAGLLWAVRVRSGLERQPDDTFVIRNFFKCRQAFGDAVLIAFGQYCSDPGEKKKRLKKIVEDNQLFQAYGISEHFKSAMDFRRNPSAAGEVSTAQLQAIAELWCKLFLWLESQRLAHNFTTVDTYVRWSGAREPEENSPLNNLIANLRRKKFGWRHPRERAYPLLTAALHQFTRTPHGSLGLSLTAMTAWRNSQ